MLMLSSRSVATLVAGTQTVQQNSHSATRLKISNLDFISRAELKLETWLQNRQTEILNCSLSRSCSGVRLTGLARDKLARFQSRRTFLLKRLNLQNNFLFR